MAQALTMETPVQLTLSGTAGEVTLITVPTGAAYVRARWTSGTYGYVTRTIADGVDKGSVYETYDSGVVYTLSVTPRTSSGLVGFASDANSGVVELTALPAGR